ncbi:MAG TPA: hypothetical protein VIK13_12115 [Candidatus Limnocylindrales bacterium]
MPVVTRVLVLSKASREASSSRRFTGLPRVVNERIPKTSGTKQATSRTHETIWCQTSGSANQAPMLSTTSARMNSQAKKR